MIKERGLQAKISKQTGIDKGVVSKYFNSKYIGNKNKAEIERCLSLMGRNHMKNPNAPITNPNKKKGNRRTDIVNNLGFGDQKVIAEKYKTSPQHVSHVLLGTNSAVNQNTELSRNITKEAELMAAINIWKTRFCKFKSLL